MGSTNKHSSDTKQYKIVKKQSNKKRMKKHSKLKKAIIIFAILIFLLILIGGGVLAGIFFSDKWALTKEELIANGNTEVYDSKGKQIAVLSSQEGNGNRKVITIDKMGKYTADAYIAIEDKRFYEHSGVDILRTAKATISYMLNKGDSSDVGGGSTITQQLVKNLMKDDADSGSAGVERKIREMSRAYHIESLLTKQQIMEKYLNIIFIGGNDLHGVEYGAQYYFGKPAKKLDLAESAFLAGINQAPNMYDPYDEEEDNSELIKERVKLVLSFMKEQNRISEDAEEAEKLYNEAVEKVEKGLKFKKGKIEIGNISYFVNEAVNDAAEDLAEEKEVDFEEARQMIMSGGYKLYTTQVTSIQNKVINEMAKDSYIETKRVSQTDSKGKTKNVTIETQAGMTIIEPTTGNVVAMGGALGSDSGTNYNYALAEKQTGSSIKPLVDVAPALEEKVITAATVFDDSITNFKGLTYKPKNAGGYQGLCTVRKAIEVSSNIVNMKILYTSGINRAIEYLHEFGLDTYTEEDDGILTLAIGGAAHGSNTLQMAAAYACLANGGEYIEPTFYEKLTDIEGNIVLKPEQEKRRVISAANAYIISDILKDVVTGSQGTAYACYMDGMDVAAKTGTTDNDTNVWLCGYTPYYAAATWYGYSSGDYELYNISGAKNLWANVMKKVHTNLENKRFTKPNGVVTAKVCRATGKLATQYCGSTYTEYFTKGNTPKACDGHKTVRICTDSGKLATQYCPHTRQQVYTSRPEMEDTTNWTVPGASKYIAPTAKCTIHTEATTLVTIPNLIGKTENEAIASLKELAVQIIYETHEDKENDVVIRQSLAQGTKVNKGSNIIITVNTVEVAPEPEVETKTQNSTENQETPKTNTENSTNNNAIE